jgi:hypothetical protein
MQFAGGVCAACELYGSFAAKTAAHDDKRILVGAVR